MCLSCLRIICLCLGEVENEYWTWEDFCESYEDNPHEDSELKESQHKARRDLWNWSNAIKKNGAAAQMLAAFDGKIRQTLLGFLFPKADQPRTITEIEIKTYATSLKKPEKNKPQEKCKWPLEDKAKDFIITFLAMIYKAFDRKTKILRAVIQSAADMSTLKIKKNEVDYPILKYNFYHSRFQDAAENVKALLGDKYFGHTLFIADPPWGITKDSDSPEWDHASKVWGSEDFDDVLRFVLSVNPNRYLGDLFHKVTIIFHVPDYYIPPLLAVVQAHNLYYTIFVWAKNSGNKMGNLIRWAHELMVVVSNRRNTVRDEKLYNKDFPERYDISHNINSGFLSLTYNIASGSVARLFLEQCKINGNISGMERH